MRFYGTEKGVLNPILNIVPGTDNPNHNALNSYQRGA